MKADCALRISAKLENLSEVRRFVWETALSLGVDSVTLQDMLLAVDEAVTNIIMHGYRGREGHIDVEVGHTAGALVVRLRDEAAPFDPTRVSPPDLTLPLEQRAVGGMGIYLIRQVVDEVSHCITTQGGNELTLVKKGTIRGY
jgi:serine/threonine-protein kinase RsbW